MEFKVSSGELLKHLNVVAGAIHTNPVLAITEDFLVDIKKGTMTLTATNLETSISTRLAVESKENGSVAIPAKDVYKRQVRTSGPPIVAIRSG